MDMRLLEMGHIPQTIHERVPNRRNVWACGLKLVDSTHYDPEVCTLCKQILKKKGRIEKIEAHIER